MKKDHIINTLLERRAALETSIENLKKKEYDHKGIFTTRSINGKERIFRREPGIHGNGEYLGEDKKDIAVCLAEKDRDEKMTQAALEEIVAIDKAVAILQKSQNYDEVFNSLPQVQQKLIKDNAIDVEFLKKWESVKYVGNPKKVQNPCTTLKGETVRSKSEKFIADSLFKEGIPYRYEYPLTRKGWPTKYPDFTILNPRTHEEIIWEHFGKMDDPDYCEKALHKMEFYYKNGYSLKKNLIITQESSRRPFDPGFWVERLIEEYLR